MKVLIVGSKGMLGQALACELKAGNELFLWDKEEIDITKELDLRFKIKDLRPEIVINSAAYNNVDGAEVESELANKVNGYAVGYLAAICKDLDITLVHYSTDYVFDGEKKEGYAETDEPNPISVYGYSKYLGEQELQKKTDKFYLIRLSKLFGKEAGSTTAKKSFVRKIMDLAQTGKELGVPQKSQSDFKGVPELGVPQKSQSDFKGVPELEVVDEELSCPTYAPDLAKRTKILVDQQFPFGIYHCTNSGAATWFGMAQEIFKISGINVKLIPVPASHFPRPAKRPRYGILLNTKLPPARDWREALDEFLNLTNM